MRANRDVRLSTYNQLARATWRAGASELGVRAICTIGSLRRPALRTSFLNSLYERHDALHRAMHKWFLASA